MLIGMIFAGWATASVSWAHSPTFALICTGSQTAYLESAKGQSTKQTIPWQETFSVDLTKGLYCAQSCNRKFSMNALSQEALDLDNATSGAGSSFKRFHPSSGVMETKIIVGGSQSDHLHVEQSGTCKMTAAKSL